MAESAVLAPNPSDPAALIAEPSTSIRISPPVWMFEVPLSIAPNPVAMEPDARAPVRVMLSWVALGIVELMVGTPEPSVTNTPLLPVVILLRLFAVVVYRRVFVPPKVVTPVPP